MDLNAIYLCNSPITDVYLGEIPIMNFNKTTIWNFEYSGTFQTFTAPRKGSYKLECWGAEGGYRNSTTSTTKREGKGGYTCGELILNKGDILYVYVGQFGNSVSNTTSYSFNGGGSGASANQAGGGATDIRLTSGNWDNSDGLLSRIIVAGGGGSVGAVNKAGGAGGGTSGISKTENYGTGGTGGSQTSAGSKYGAFGKGGYGTYLSSGYGGAGGGGWYGGGGVTPDSSGDDDRGGGGGSGYVLTSTSSKPSGYTPTSKYYLSNTELITGNLSSVPNPDGGTMTGKSENGFARITYLDS